MTPQVYEILLAEDDLSDAELTVQAMRQERRWRRFRASNKGT